MFLPADVIKLPLWSQIKCLFSQIFCSCFLTSGATLSGLCSHSRSGVHVTDVSTTRLRGKTLRRWGRTGRRLCPINAQINRLTVVHVKAADKSVMARPAGRSQTAGWQVWQQGGLIWVQVRRWMWWIGGNAWGHAADRWRMAGLGLGHAWGEVRSGWRQRQRSRRSKIIQKSTERPVSSKQNYLLITFYLCSVCVDAATAASSASLSASQLKCFSIHRGESCFFSCRFLLQSEVLHKDKETWKENLWNVGSSWDKSITSVQLIVCNIYFYCPTTQRLYFIIHILLMCVSKSTAKLGLFTRHKMFFRLDYIMSIASIVHFILYPFVYLFCLFVFLPLLFMLVFGTGEFPRRRFNKVLSWRMPFIWSWNRSDK